MEKNYIIFVNKKLHCVNFWTWILNFLKFLD